LWISLVIKHDNYNLFSIKKPGTIGQVIAIRLGLNQIFWNGGVMEYWSIGFDGRRTTVSGWVMA
jgi:hypothetical protein